MVEALVGQILRYMGFVKDEIAQPGQTVKGVIVALDDGLRIKRALSASGTDIEFFRYEINFALRRVQ